MSIEVHRQNQKRIRVEAEQGSTNRFTVSFVLWFARELQQAVDEEGLPQDAEVHFENNLRVHGTRLWTDTVLVQEIP